MDHVQRNEQRNADFHFRHSRVFCDNGHQRDHQQKTDVGEDRDAHHKTDHCHDPGSIVSTGVAQ
ncbi:hypothetical protein D3C80_2100380 [compost metagenome]